MGVGGKVSKYFSETAGRSPAVDLIRVFRRRNFLLYTFERPDWCVDKPPNHPPRFRTADNNEECAIRPLFISARARVPMLETSICRSELRIIVYIVIIFVYFLEYVVYKLTSYKNLPELIQNGKYC